MQNYWCLPSLCFRPPAGRNRDSLTVQRVAVVEELHCAAFSQKSFHQYQTGVCLKVQNVPPLLYDSRSCWCHVMTSTQLPLEGVLPGNINKPPRFWQQPITHKTLVGNKTRKSSSLTWKQTQTLLVTCCMCQGDMSGKKSALRRPPSASLTESKTPKKQKESVHKRCSWRNIFNATHDSGLKLSFTKFKTATEKKKKKPLQKFNTRNSR